ncbi:hypothetical protein FCL54_06390 [Pseudalkalibacillus caeni]|uniref:Uncharacterized protein n=2 Tax=Exobacillus caeni TaxID=2574798 RepID=A0A5R9FFK4_9BACL|nr:hypothetical protein FCL54_06390 [Pseudalkalibacillus caeni]
MMNGDMHTLCKRYLNYHIKAHMQNGMEYEGIITDVDERNMTLLVPEEVGEEQVGRDGDERQFGYRRFRRFRPYLFPLAAVGSMSLVPFFRPYPYPYYPYY